MKKSLLKVTLALSVLALSMPSSAQLSASLTQAPLPTVAGPVLRPQNAGSSTMQNINFPGVGVNNLYIHSWDVFSSGPNNGIAWRRTNTVGTTLNQGYLNIKYADDIDVALYQSGSDFYALAAYYYNDGTINKGHYYDIYKFSATGLTPVSTMNFLGLSASFGRINVDANSPYGIAIIWCTPSVGINVKVANLPFTGFGPTVTLLGTSSYKDPDICINRYTGNLALQMVYLANSNNLIREYRLDFFTALAGSSAGIVNEHNVSTTNTFSTPRIDCPDGFIVQKWAYVYSEYSVSGTSVGERIWGVVHNTNWSAVPTQVLVRSTSYTTTTGYQQNNPVLAYNANVDQITVGWMTKESTTVIPLTNDVKYVAEYIKDAGTGAPSAIPTSFMMISNQPGGPAPVLAFSGQNAVSGYNGLYAAYSQYNTYFAGNYCMVYKSKPWSSGTFKMLDNEEGIVSANNADITFYPVPFINSLNFAVPAKGDYQISIVNIEGKVVSSLNETLDVNQKISINTENLVSGIYFVRVISKENDINITRKVVK